MEDICRQQSCSHSGRNSSSDMETCAISIQSCRPHIKGNRTHNIIDIHTMVEGITVAFAGAIQLAYNRDQLSYRQLANQNRSYGMSTTTRKHHPEILQAKQTHQSLLTAEDSYTTADNPRPTGKQPPSPHKIWTRL